MRGLIVAITLIALALPAAAAQTTGSDLYLPDTLVVAVGETLRIEAGTRVHGPGHIEVHGKLVAIGTTDAPIRFHAPIALHGNQSTQIAHATVERIPGAAVTLFAGTLTLEDTQFLSNLAGIVVSGPGNATLTIRNSTFESHADTALRLGLIEAATLDHVKLANNVMGLTIRLDETPATRLVISNSTFENHADHLRIEVAAHADPHATVAVRDSRFTGPDGTFVVAGAHGNESHAGPSIHLEGNRFESTDVAVRLEGRDYAFESRNDTFSGNLVGISSPDTSFILIGTRFDSRERDLDLGPAAHLEAQNVSFTPPPSATQLGATKVWPVVGGMLALIGVAALVAAAARARRAPDSAQPAADDEPPMARPPTPSRTEMPRFSTMELRILHDIAEHPDTAQSETAARLNVSRQAAHYHIKKLVAGGFILKTDHGRTTACRIARHVRLTSLPPAVTQQGAVEKE